jgi:tRNA(Ile)-lysidine synthase
MAEDRHRRELDNHQQESRAKVAHPLFSAQRTIAAVERRVAGVLANLPSGRRQRLLVAVSGGPDSVAILHALYRIRQRSHFELAAAHLNHGIRGLEAARDERFVRDLCGRLKIELVVERVHGLKLTNLEERARELRYEFLNRTADALEAQSIVLGHHQDDQAETVLLRLLRGTGIAGLSAMAELGPGRLVRPLLSLDRAGIIEYLAVIGADYVVDSSNLQEGALRNRVRAGLLPLFARDYSPGIVGRLAELASEMRELNSFLEAKACEALDRLLIPPAAMSRNSSWRMDVRRFESISPAVARAVIREFIRRGVGDLRRIERVHIETMCRVAAGHSPSAAVTLPRGWRFRREYDTVVLEHMARQESRTSYPALGGGEQRLMPGANRLDGATLIVREIRAQEPCFPAAPWHPPSKFEAYFDAAIAPTLTVRCFRAGDRIRPLGLCGSRKIHDVFVDHKVPVASRRSWPLVAWGEEVIWIPGLVRSRLALLNAASKKVVHLRADLLLGGLKV